MIKGRNLYQMHIDQGLSVNDIAKLIGVSAPYISSQISIYLDYINKNSKKKTYTYLGSKNEPYHLNENNYGYSKSNLLDFQLIKLFN